MKSVIFKASLMLALLVSISFVGTLPSSSDIGRSNLKRQLEGKEGRTRAAVKRARPLTYRSPGATHKLVIRSNDLELHNRLRGSRLAHRAQSYGEFSIVEVTNEALASIDASALERAELRDDFNLIMLKRGQIDTTSPEPKIDAELKQRTGLSRSLHLVQLFGPPTPEALETLKATGARIVSYVPNNTYLLWATPAQIARVGQLQRTSGAVQWTGPYHPAYKLDARLKLDSDVKHSISVQVLDAPESIETINRIKSIASDLLMKESHAAGLVHLKVQVETGDLKELARMPEVLGIEPWAEMKTLDERANQIVAGAISTESVNNILVSRPSAPGYLAFLNSLGFNSDFNFSVDVGDTGFDKGSGQAGVMHPDFVNALGASRIAYLQDFSGDAHTPDQNVLPAHDTAGHGTINASIIGGFNDKTGGAFADSLGFRYGLGVAPFAQVGISKLFKDNGAFGNLSYVDHIAGAYRAGARISSNSWGACVEDFCNLYTDDCTVFDSLVRDADPSDFGNQGMVIVFASGNEGDIFPLSVSTPGTSKNVITVGATENFLPTDGNGSPINDLCGVGQSEADNAQDIIDFSGFGPVQDGRTKPDIVAPGTHITGAASQDTLFNGAGICGVPGSDYFPLGQKLYTISSGTSHATPMVSGAAALAFQWLRNLNGSDASPALIKALMLNSASYVTGRFGNDDLPGARQGWGLLNIARMFEDTDRILYDQSPERTFTQSGGPAFETTGEITDATKEFRVMLTWTDAPGNAATNAPYVNQLNLEVVVGGVVYRGNNFNKQYSEPGGATDFLNNTQSVRLPAGTTGPFIVRVRPTIIAGDGVPGNQLFLDQDFALAVTNGRETAIPVLAIEQINDVSLGVSVVHTGGVADQSLRPGEVANITVSVSNLSQTAGATITSASLSFATGGNAAGSFGAIQPGQSATNAAPFQLQVPSNLRCGSVATLNLQLDTNVGRFTLPVRVQVGRPQGLGTVLLSDNVDTGGVKWKKKKGFETSSLFANSGTMSYHIEDPGLEDGDNRLGFLRMKKALAIPANAGQVRLSFFHIFNFEPGYDGGVLEISDDDGNTWQDLGSRMIVGGYDGTVTTSSNNPLGSRLSWTARGQRGVFSQVIVNLDDFAGKSIRIRFHGGFDNAVGIRDGFTGWFIDDIQITANTYQCP